MRFSITTRSVTALVFAFFVLAAVFMPMVEAKYTGACVKKKLQEKDNLQYYIRIPDGQAMSHDRRGVPGKSYYDNLSRCSIRNFTCMYDIEGNAHVDFVLMGRRKFNLPNKCDVEKHISRATFQQYQPRCVEGNHETLYQEWRASWRA